MINVLGILEKLALTNDQENDVALGVGGTAAVSQSGKYLSGKKRMYHGTSQKSWEKIKDEGLRSERGGMVGGGGAGDTTTEIGAGEYQEASKGHVHVTNNTRMANNYTHFASDKERVKDIQTRLRNGDAKAQGEFEALVNAPHPEGKVVRMNLDYNKFKQMEADPYVFSLSPFDRNHDKDLAARGKIDISPEEILDNGISFKRRALHTLHELPAYIKHNPLRFGAGLGLAGAGGLMMGKAVHDLTDHHKSEISKRASEIIASR